jgi:Flp pilus assembly protein protease CpaA
MTQVHSARTHFARACKTPSRQHLVTSIVRACKKLVPVGIGALALGWVFPETFALPAPLALGGMLVLFLWISVNDFKTRRVPNTVTYPLIVVGIIRAIAFHDGIFLLYWVVFFTLWTVRFIGGGDAKLLMGLFGLFPDVLLAWCVALCVIVTGLPYLAYKYRQQWRTIPRTLFWRLVTRQFLPSQAEFEQDAVPYAFSFCLAGAAYLLAPFVPR